MLKWYNHKVIFILIKRRLFGDASEGGKGLDHIPFKDQEKTDSSKKKLKDIEIIDGKEAKKEIQSNKISKKKIWRILSFICSVILIPAILTIVLAAFEDETNQWVRQLFGDEEKVVEKIKRLASVGELIHISCGKIGSSVMEVKNACGPPSYENQTFDKKMTTHQLRYIKEGDESGYVLSFINEKLDSILLINDPKLENIKINEMKQVFGPVKDRNTNEGKGDNEDRIYYSYMLEESYLIRFTFDANNGKLVALQLDSEDFPPPINIDKKLDMVQSLDSSKSVEHLEGVKLAKKIKEWIQEGDMFHYNCGFLGSTLEMVESQCGTEAQSAIGYDRLTDEKWRNYRYKEREIGLKFYKDELSLISVREIEKPLSMKRQDVIEVFGKGVDPKPTLRIDPNQYLKYEWDTLEIQFFFNEQGDCHYVVLKKRGMYDDTFGQLILSNKND